MGSCIRDNMGDFRCSGANVIPTTTSLYAEAREIEKEIAYV